MHTGNQILTILREKKDSPKQKYPISELGILGSYARRTSTKEGDIDVLVDFNGRIDGFEYIRPGHELEDSFSQPIDLVSRKGIRLPYLPYVEKRSAMSEHNLTITSRQ